MAVHQHFDTLEDLLACEIHEKNEGHSCTPEIRGECPTRERSTADWFGPGGDWDANRVGHAVKHGWQEGLTTARETVKTLGALPVIAQYRRRQVWGDQGSQIDMNRVWDGRLEAAWRTTRRDVRTSMAGSHVIRIAVNLSTVWTKTGIDYFWRGAAALVLADLLEDSGRSVEIIAYVNDRHKFKGGRDRDSVVTVVLKRPDEPLNPSRLATCLALSGFLRCCIWRAQMSLPRVVAENQGLQLVKEIPDEVTQDGERLINVADIWSEKQSNDFLGKVVEEFE